ncbi:unnamed protein product, partial [marine sediment metagenome]
WEHPGKEKQYPEVEEKVCGDKVELWVGDEQGKWELALVPVEGVEPCKRALNSLINHYIKDPRVAEIIRAADQLKEMAAPLRSDLLLVINRRMFKGVCSICCDMGVG